MAKLGGSGVAATPDLDDRNVKDDEVVWRLIDPQYYHEDPNNPGKRIIDVATFSHNKKGVSLLRPHLLGSDPCNYIQQRFPKWGIAELKAEDVRKLAGCLFAIEPDPNFNWPPDSHVCIYKAPRKNRLKPWQCDKLVELAEQRLIVIPVV
jgi:hypothetical protein